MSFWTHAAALLTGAALASAAIILAEAISQARAERPKSPARWVRMRIAQTLTCGHTRSTKGCTLCDRRK